MSEWFWKKLNLFFGLGVLVVLFGLAILEANVEIQDLDLWLHLATGRHIIDNFSIPQADIFSASLYGSPWINHEWLFQVIVYSMYQFLGIEGIILLQVGLVCLTLWFLITWVIHSEFRTGVLFCLLLVVLNYQLRFTHRPDLFSLLFFVGMIQLLSRGLRDKSTYLAIFLLQVLWTNMHGFFYFGTCSHFSGLARGDREEKDSTAF